MLNHVYENEFKLYVNENLQSCERMSTRTCFEMEAKGNSEMGICYVKNFCAVGPSNLNWNISDDNHNSGWCKKSSAQNQCGSCVVSIRECIHF